ncbi:MAG: transcriptional regulator, partial [Eubacterium sp.]
MIDKNGIERCDIAHDHKNIIKEVRGKMPDEEMLYDLAELFKVFGDSTRVRI